MLELFNTLFGEYQPIELPIEQIIDGEIIQTGTEYMVNFGYIAYAVFVIIILYSALRILGGIICK